MSASYREIVRSSSIMGGAQIINYAVGLLRVKVVALLLGTVGVGVISLYTSATSLLGIVTGLGLQGSAVRAVARAQGKGDSLAVARTIRMLRRLCWATGALGWLASVMLAVPLSRLVFDSSDHAWALAILGGALMLTAISNGQLGLLQGLRRIGDIARVQVTAAILNTTATIALYAWLRERGIVPVLLLNALISLVSSWWFARRIEVPMVRMDWTQAVTEVKPMLSLGVAMMWSGLATSALDLFARTVITREWGVDATGLYQAAWALSGMFAAFVLSAMGADFYPRLTSVIHRHAAAIDAVNEQTEIGILLALPGLLATLAFSKWIIWLLYSAEFAPAADVLAWMVLGVFGRVLSWPLGYIQLAIGAGRWFMATETLFIALWAGLVAWLVPRIGIMGTAYAFVALYALHTVCMRLVGHHLIGFRWSASVRRMMLVSSVLVAVALAINRLVPGVLALVMGGTVSVIGTIWCLRELIVRLGVDHHLVRRVLQVPGVRRLARV